MNVKKDLECIIMSFDEPTYGCCLESIKRQTFQPARIARVNGVTPISDSIMKRHEIMELPFSVKVDADMILYPECFTVLYTALKTKLKAGENKYYAVTAFLEDPLIGRMGAIHLERTELVKEVNVPDVIGCDRVLREKMKRKGFEILEVQSIVGEHWSDWSTSAVFKRHARMGQKHFYYRDKHHEDWIKNLGDKWINKKNDTAFLALLGYCYGLLTPDVIEKDGNAFMIEEWEAVEELIRDKVIPKPKQLWSQQNETGTS